MRLACPVGWALLIAEFAVIVFAGREPELGYIGTFLIFGLILTGIYIAGFAFAIVASLVVLSHFPNTSARLQTALGTALFIVGMELIFTLLAGMRVNEILSVALSGIIPGAAVSIVMRVRPAP